MRMRTIFLYSFFLYCSNLWSVQLESLLVQAGSAGKASILCSFSGPYRTPKVFALSHPERVVIDFEQTNTAINVAKIPLGYGLIAHARSGHPTPQTFRLVFDVKQPVSVSSASWTPKHAGQSGLRIEIQPRAGGRSVIASQTFTAKKTSAAQRVQPSQATTSHTPIHVQHAPPRSLRDVVIVLDPGHGGKDPGAIGANRNVEKNVVLAIALKLKQMIDKQPGMRAVLTRNGDYYVGLRERLNIARRYNGDIFVSIHADAFINRQSNGASVFALSPTGATSEAARWLAEKENYSELGGVNLSGLDDQNGLIRTVLIDLSQTATIGASLQMGGRVLRHLDRMTTLHNNKVEQARFVVLKSPDIPSILVETGFISNPREEKNLTSSFYQARLTQAIFEGVKSYFWDYPPHGTRLEAMAGSMQHIVHRGETLPAIASHYKVSVAALKSANHLYNLRVRPGQALSIPSSWG